MTRQALRRLLSSPDTLVVLVIALLVLTLPSFKFSFDIGTVLTVISLIFAILVGFFFAAATSNYLRLQSLITQEDAALITIYNLTQLIQPSGAPAVAETIDAYMIAVLDYEILTYAPGVAKELQAVVDAVDRLQPEDERGMNLIQTIHGAKASLYATNQETALAAKQIVSGHHWLVVILLALFIDILLLSLRDGTLINAFIVFAVIVTLYKTLTLVHEVDSNLFLAKQLAFKSPQHVFEAIGRLRYYPETAFADGQPRPTGTYRLGRYKNLAESYEKTIETVS